MYTSLPCDGPKDWKGCKSCAKLLLSHGARVDYDSMWNALQYGCRDVVKMLLRAGGARAMAIAYSAVGPPLRSPAKEAAFEVLDAVRAAGGWPEYAAAHRCVLAGLVAKLGAKGSEFPQPLPLDAAGHVVAFYCPPGGF